MADAKRDHTASSRACSIPIFKTILTEGLNDISGAQCPMRGLLKYRRAALAALNFSSARFLHKCLKHASQPLGIMDDKTVIMYRRVVGVHRSLHQLPPSVGFVVTAFLAAKHHHRTRVGFVAISFAGCD